MEPKPMRIDSKEPAKTPSVPGAPILALSDDQFVRRLDHPYFELRTPDAQASTYVEGNSAKMIMADEEKLSRFLAPAQLVTDQNTTPKKRLIRYQIDPEKYKNVRPLDAIPESELKAFEEAAKDFYDKAAPDRKDVHPYETFLRFNFKLPDPEREPDAYLVYGTEFERQLLVLWGAEKQKDTSLPISKHEVVRLRKGEEPVTEKLRRRVIGWEQTQKDTLLLLAKTREPLFRFLGEPVIDDKGVLKGVKIGEIALTSAQIRPLRYILPPEMKAFQKACAEFYARAATATSSYEKELRKNFQLPDLDKLPGSFRVHGPMNGPRLVILCEALVRREQTIWLTPAPALNIPPAPAVTPEQELLGHKPAPPPTLTDQLQHKVIPFGKIFAVGGAIVATPILIALLIWLALDKSPPKLASVIPAEEPKAVLAEFNEPIDASTVPKEATAISKSFVLVSSNSGPVPILSATLTTTGKSKNREIKLVTGSDFGDGAGYNLSVNNLKDRALLHNQIRKSIHFGFVYEDAKPPVLGMPSGDGESLGHLELPFSKVMDADSVKDAANYTIDGSNFKVNSASLDEDKKTVSLVFSPDMQLKTDHTIVVKNVKDASKKGNKLNPDPTTIEFKFVDTLPPKLRHVTAEEQNRVVLEFNEKVSAATVTNLANYTLMTTKDGKKLDIYLAELTDPKKVSLVTASLHKDIDYDVSVQNVSDVADPPNAMTNAMRLPFKLDPSRENHSSPHIENVSQQPDRTKIIVNFGVTNRLRPDLVLSRSSFSLKMLNNDKEMDFSSTIVSVTDPFVSDFPPGIERVSILLSAPLEKAQTYKISARGLQDIWGNSNAVSDQVLAVKGFIKELQSQSVKFSDASKKSISITLSWEIDESSLAPANFIVPGRKVTGVEFGDNHYIIKLKLDGPVTADRFTVSCLNLRLAGTSVVGPQLDCSGPDR